MRWRRRGAWMWPVLVAATGVDAVIGHQLPASGEGEAAVAAGLIGLVLNVLGVVLLARPLGLLLRRRRADLPAVVARDYAGTATVLLITAALLAIGLLHHERVVRDRRAMQDAITRAQAFIGTYAPSEFRRDVEWVNMFTIQPGSIYRACVPGRQDGRTYCVIVNTSLPLARSVRFSGYEPNSTFGVGVN